MSIHTVKLSLFVASVLVVAAPMPSHAEERQPNSASIQQIKLEMRNKFLNTKFPHSRSAPEYQRQLAARAQRKANNTK